MLLPAPDMTSCELKGGALKGSSRRVAGWDRLTAFKNGMPF